MQAAKDTSTPTTAPSPRNQLRPVKFDYADSFACTYAVSVVAASIAELATYPLDLTKTRLQIQGEGVAGAAKVCCAFVLGLVRLYRTFEI